MLGSGILCEALMLFLSYMTEIISILKDGARI
jgi:hypothetical protein